ncbi:hypothetical protein D0U02_29580 [Burkholderia pseudomallei]|nr:hypothetical protein D0U05_28200 [Burkholderia pseudomallei]RFS54735.1 hypothetical protein D0U02_29580 [Burkholderia pseudomallei]RFS56917.1 hypothetical protein D0U01_29585 [Burkholderia pseudomallei]RFS71506.1 hypothetical protein D0T98_23890 [Burkholderia pseudomallei]
MAVRYTANERNVRCSSWRWLTRRLGVSGAAAGIGTRRRRACQAKRAFARCRRLSAIRARLTDGAINAA